MSRWRALSALAVGWWLGRLAGFVVASWRLSRWLSRQLDHQAPDVDREEAQHG